MTEQNAELVVLRALLETEDRELVEHLMRRRELVGRVAKLKQLLGLPQTDQEREDRLRMAWSLHAAKAGGPDLPAGFWRELHAVFDTVLDFCQATRDA